MAVPFMDFRGDRNELNSWALKKGDDGIKEYWEEKNVKSFDGHSTGIFE